MSVWWWVIPLIKILIIVGVLQGAVAYLIYVERKLAAFFQDRLGPNRVGPHGLLQPLADGVKFVLKEDIIPTRVDRPLYLVAPAIGIITTTIAFAVVPFGPVNFDAVQGRTAVEVRQKGQFVIAPGVDIGIVYVFAVGSLTVYSVLLGGWASNSKYSFIGGLRSSAQLISYEIPMGLSILGVVLIARSLKLGDIIGDQASRQLLGIRGWWNVVWQFPAFVVFLVAAFAESNRLPFDLPEAEQELVGGFHTEYSAMKFAMFFLSEYTHIITASFLTVILFFGGWHFWGIATWDTVAWWSVPIKIIVLAVKAFLVIVFMMWVRWTLPRFRYDQLMGLAWKVLIPISLVNLLLTAFFVQVYRG